MKVVHPIDQRVQIAEERYQQATHRLLQANETAVGISRRVREASDNLMVMAKNAVKLAEASHSHAHKRPEEDEIIDADADADAE